MGKIWLDVSTLLGWRRPAVGIVRVETECAAYALQGAQVAQDGLRFCCFDALGGYRQVSPDAVAAALARIQGVPAGGAGAPAQPAPPAALTPASAAAAPGQRFKRLVLRLINALPTTLRVPVFNFAARREPALVAAVRAGRELWAAFKSLLRPASDHFLPAPMAALPDQASRRPNAPFAAGDVYVSMGLDWDQKDLVYLYEQKRILGFKVLLFCYDVIPVKLPHLCVGDVAASFARYFANVAWCANEVLCISECTRTDLRALLVELGTPLPTLSVIRLGCQLPLMASESIASDVAPLLGQRYVLFVSTIERRKNHETLYRAYARLVEQGETHLPLLVFVGMPGWGVNDLMADLRFDPRTQDLIKLLHHVTDADLARLYQHALFTAFPSLYEGWGLPVAESLAAGKFCLASSAASMPEVGGDLIEYLDPWDVPAWAARLRWYFNHPDLLAEKEARIKQDYQPTSWPACAHEILVHATGRIRARP